jgi:hypothetical protein
MCHLLLPLYTGEDGEKAKARGAKSDRAFFCLHWQCLGHAWASASDALSAFSKNF